MKRAHRTFKLCLSVGGWTYSKNFAGIAADATKRATFVTACVALIKDLALDGIDLDWEFPSNQTEADNFLLLVTQLRKGLNDLATSKKETNPYQLSIAAPAYSTTYAFWPLAKLAPVVDYLHLMSYNFFGSWTPTSGNHAQLHGKPDSGEEAIKFYMAHGVPAKKIILGCPLYGMSFANTENGAGKAFNGAGRGTWNKGIVDYKKLPLANTTITVDTVAVGASCYDATAKEWVSFDDPQVMRLKCDWVKKMGLGGVMFWELSGDKSGEGSLVLEAAKSFSKLDTTPNHLDYPTSRYTDVADGI
jgi:chitinase